MSSRTTAKSIEEREQASALVLVRSLWEQADREREKMAESGDMNARDHSTAVLAAWLVAALVDARTARAMLVKRHISGGTTSIHTST